MARTKALAKSTQLANIWRRAAARRKMGVARYTRAGWHGMILPAYMVAPRGSIRQSPGHRLSIDNTAQLRSNVGNVVAASLIGRVFSSRQPTH